MVGLFRLGTGESWMVRMLEIVVKAGALLWVSLLGWPCSCSHTAAPGGMGLEENSPMLGKSCGRMPKAMQFTWLRYVSWIPMEMVE